MRKVIGKSLSQYGNSAVCGAAEVEILKAVGGMDDGLKVPGVSQFCVVRVNSFAFASSTPRGNFSVTQILNKKTQTLNDKF